MKRIVGIVPTAKLFETDDYYKDNYIFVNNYSKRVAACGGIPMGLLADDGYAFEEALARCDALLLCGGGRIFPYHFQSVQHAVEHVKPLLGICLGMQAIHSYFRVADEAARRGWTGELLELYELMKRERVMFTLPVEHHWDVHMTRDNVNQCKHPVHIAPGTRLRALLGADCVPGASMHRYRINEPAPQLTVAGATADGVVEAVEQGSNVLGVQFHPEVDGELDALFRFICGTLPDAPK